MLGAIHRYFDEGLWAARLQDAPWPKRIVLRVLRILVLTAHGFADQQLGLRASALTFFTLLSIVPVAAMAFGVAKGFGFQQRLERMLREQLEGQEAIAERIIQFAQSMLDNAQGGVVAGVGVVILFGAVIRLMGNIENAFNAVWHVSRPRGIARKFSDYLAFVVLAPLVLIVASSGAVFIAAELRQTVATVGPGWGEQMALRLAVSAFPLVLLWALFTFMYVFMPNTRVPWLSAVIGGIVGGSAYALLQFVYIRFQIGASNAGAVYGSFAALPLFLIWLQLSWLVVLLGAQLAYAHANVHAYARRRAGEGATHSLQRVLALALCGRCVAAFQQGQAPPTARDLAQALGVPQGLVNEALERLVAAGLLSEVVGEADEASGYQPAVPSEHLNTLMVLDRFDGGLPDGLSHALAPYAEALRNLQHGLAQSPQNLPLAQLAQHRRNR